MPRQFKSRVPLCTKVYVHYFVNAAFGIVQIHFSASGSKHGGYINNKTLFDLAVAGMQTIPSKDKQWDTERKVWSIHSDVWANLMPYYSVAPEIYEMISYNSRAGWESFITGIPQNLQNDGQAASDFFGAQAFNNAVFQTATLANDKDEFVTLLSLSSWSQFDSMDAATAKKQYRKAAIALHPDKNGGDGSKMARLNQLWSIYGSR